MKRYAIIMKHDPDPNDPREDDNLGTMVCWHPRYNLGDEQIDQPDSFYKWVFETFDLRTPALDNYEYEHGYLNQYPTDKEQLRFDELAKRIDHKDLDDKEQEEYDFLYDRCENYEPDTKFFEDTIDDWVINNLAHRNLYLYDHSGITMSTQPFSCGWDSGMVGMIYCTREKAEKEGVKFDDLPHILISEVTEYDKYLTGECYGLVAYELPDDFEMMESLRCSEDTYVIDEGTRLAIDIERDLEEVSSCWGFLGYDYAESEAKGYVANYI